MCDGGEERAVRRLPGAAAGAGRWPPSYRAGDRRRALQHAALRDYSACPSYLLQVPSDASLSSDDSNSSFIKIRADRHRAARPVSSFAARRRRLRWN